MPGSGVLNEGQHLFCTPPPPSVHVGHQSVVLFVCVRICTNVAGSILANKYKHKVPSLCPFVSAIPFRNKDLQCNSVLALRCHETSCCIEHSREFFLSGDSHCGAQSCPRFTCKWKTGIAEPAGDGILVTQAATSCPYRWRLCQDPTRTEWPAASRPDGCPPEQAALPHAPGLERHAVGPAAAPPLYGLGNGLVHGEAFGR